MIMSNACPMMACPGARAGKAISPGVRDVKPSAQPSPRFVQGKVSDAHPKWKPRTMVLSPVHHPHIDRRLSSRGSSRLQSECLCIQIRRNLPKPLPLLAGRLVGLRGVPGMREHLAELVLSEQLVRFQVLKGTRACDRYAQGGGADRVRDIYDDDPVVGPEHPVRGLKRSAH
jgi:hypothetical protein